jgi:hypothetical protein
VKDAIQVFIKNVMVLRILKLHSIAKNAPIKIMIRKIDSPWRRRIKLDRYRSYHMDK